MAVGVYMPKKQQGGSAGAAQLIGGAIGGYVSGGSPQGIGVGMQAGGMANNIVNPQKEQAQPIQANALQRRQEHLDNSAQRQIAQSIDSLKFVEDDGQRAELAKPLLMAQQAAAKKPGGLYGG